MSIMSDKQLVSLVLNRLVTMQHMANACVEQLLSSKGPVESNDAVESFCAHVAYQLEEIKRIKDR